MSVRIVVPVVAAVLLGASASPGEAPCAADVRRFCEGKTPLEVLSCLQTHQPELSDQCKLRVDHALVKFQDARLDCEADAFAYCRDAASGEPMVTCLSKHQGQLTRRCQDTFEDFAKKEAANKQVCGGDASRLCPNVKPGKGDVHLCLVFHGKELSTACREALTR